MTAVDAPLMFLDDLQPSRRVFLMSLALVGMGACSGGSARPATDLGRARTTDPVLPAGGGSGSTHPSAEVVLRRQLERLTFGVTPALWAEVNRVGLSRWLDDQLSAPPAGDTLLSAIDARVPSTAAFSSASKEARQQLRVAIIESLTLKVVGHAAFGADQVRQRLVDCFADHLHVTVSSSPEVFFAPSYDDLLRAGVTGTFADLLVASAKSPAMLHFLDNASSRADGEHRPNENYAREVMELHTVGVDGGYDEQDVVEVAHVLSGWSLRGGEFTYRDDWHDLGSLASSGDVLGWRPPEGMRGVAIGEDLLRHLALHPATARRVSHVLARRFVSDRIAVDDPLVVSAAETYTTTGSSIAAVVHHLVTDDRFASAATLMLRRPIDLVASLLRRGGVVLDPSALDAPARTIGGLLQILGQVPYVWESPDGYPVASEAWANAGSMLSRWNTAITLAATGAASGLALDPTALGTTDPSAAALAMCGPDFQLI